MTIITGIIERAVLRDNDDGGTDRDGIDRLGEIVQEIQLGVSGSATATATWTEVEITFDIEFIDGSYQRYSNLTEPCFVYGSVTADEVVLVANVTAYGHPVKNGVTFTEIINGATVKVGCFNPGGDTITFTGRVDLQWAGWGCVANEPKDANFDV